ncbi:glutathione S-transferase [Pseudoroseomonas deserti]|uniref:Glutathione S-transferase n=1 Tax=Teichococcus deserti TaxID=1817963 RepID=A0A1V2GY48_9PROT|nr:glutathione S-transferase family protein [Pseudoroseomonas deserti]ONG50030.1 glutathione S-transferase [Pseudoroseomonas deserti]
MLTIWGRRTSSNVQALMWCVAELGLPHRRIDAGHIHGVTDTPDFLAMNPNGTVPVLRDGDGPPLFETGAILRYLAGRYARPPFWPAEGVGRAQVDQWADWAKLNVAMNFTAPVFWRVVRTAPSRRDPAAIAAAMTTLGRFLDIAEARLSRHAHLAGEDFTLADIQLGHVLHRYHDIAIERLARPALAAYHARLAERPAYRAHVMVSYEELRVLD